VASGYITVRIGGRSTVIVLRTARNCARAGGVGASSQITNGTGPLVAICVAYTANTIGIMSAGISAMRECRRGTIIVLRTLGRVTSSDEERPDRGSVTNGFRPSVADTVVRTSNAIGIP